MKFFHIIFSVFLIISVNRPTDSFAKNIIFSKQAEEYRRTGYLAYSQGNLEKAYQFFKKSLYLNPQYAIVHNDLGIVYEMRGLKELAFKEYLECIELAPEYAPPYMNLALLYQGLGDKGKAIFYLRERIKLGKKHDPWKEKAEQLLKIYESLPSAESARTQGGLEAEKTKEIDAARFLMEESVREKLASSGNGLSMFQMHLNYAKTYYEKGRYSQALEEFIAAQELEPSSAEVAGYIKDCREKIRIEDLYARGKDALESGDFALAIKQIEKLLLMDPMYKDAEDILISAEKERFIYETREEEEPILLHLP